MRSVQAPSKESGKLREAAVLPCLQHAGEAEWGCSLKAGEHRGTALELFAGKKP